MFLLMVFVTVLLNQALHVLNYKLQSYATAVNVG